MMIEDFSLDRKKLWNIRIGFIDYNAESNKNILIFSSLILIYSHKRLRARPYFRSAAALSVAPPPLPVNLAACEGLAGGIPGILES